MPEKLATAHIIKLFERLPLYKVLLSLWGMCAAFVSVSVLSRGPRVFRRMVIFSLVFLLVPLFLR